ncbi:VTT domain-containing protein [Tardiphaga sp.]|jgi:phospholipase D1/2|uniref:VTT domain-containing protein n=1 Tax=Tardiphaga sp. TaxID=1926292 RepID=UPI0037D9A58C
MDSIIAEGRTVWRHVACRRATVLNDAANYFLALRRCLIEAEHTVFIVGWDVHSRTMLVGPEGTADDGYPDEFGPFLHALLVERPELRIHLLIWNSPVIYAGEREWFPSAKFSVPNSDRLIFCYDDCLPTGSAQHQKIAVIDDSIAFSGGLDLTIRRWDSDEHRAHDPKRVDPDGKPYPPFHDVQMMVDGEAARCLAELVRDRWACANCGVASDIGVERRIWPEGFAADFERVKIGIARTEPYARGRPAINEVDRLFMASIDAAERMIYIENQFLSAEHIARKLAERLKQKPELEVLLIAPKTHASWIEARTMRNGRLEFMKVFDDAGVADRVRLLHPQVTEGATVEAVMVHAKVTIIDDQLLRIGSANLNNRSMGADSECDLVIEASNDAERNKIAAIRNRHLGHFCGVSEHVVADELKRSGSLIETAATLRDNGHSLHPVEDGIPDAKEIVDFVTPVADPLRPLGLERAARATVPTSIKLLTLVGAIGALAALWRFTPLYEFTNADTLLETLHSIEGSPWAPLAIVAGFIIGGLVLFPVTVMIAVTAAALGPWIGLGSALVGTLASASLLYTVGRIVGIKPVQRMLGPRLRRIQNKIVGNGIIAVVLIRMLPLAPFSLVNMAAGASGVRFRDFIIGTVIGMAPGLIAMSVFGAQIADLLRQPSWADVALLLFGIMVWVAFSIGAQFVVTWWSRRR